MFKKPAKDEDHLNNDMKETLRKIGEGGERPANGYVWKQKERANYGFDQFNGCFKLWLTPPLELQQLYP